MKSIPAAFAFSLGVVLFIVGIGIGYAFTPEYRRAMDKAESMGLGVADRWVDLRYINAMIAHHRGAILLAEQAKDKSTRNDIRNLSHDIIQNEPIAINELYQWKKTWFSDTQHVPDPTIVQLGTQDDTFDLRFLNALIQHHERGIDMTREILTKSTRSEILNNANTVEQFLQSSATQLKSWRTEWFKV